MYCFRVVISLKVKNWEKLRAIRFCNFLGCSASKGPQRELENSDRSVLF